MSHVIKQGPLQESRVEYFVFQDLGTRTIRAAGVTAHVASHIRPFIRASLKRNFKALVLGRL